MRNVGARIQLALARQYDARLTQVGKRLRAEMSKDPGIYAWRPSWKIRLGRTFIRFFLGPLAPKFIRFLERPLGTPRIYPLSCDGLPKWQ